MQGWFQEKGRENAARRDEQRGENELGVAQAHADNQNVMIGGSLKYLGITFDRKLNFNEHARNVKKKQERIANKIVNLTRKEYGKNTVFKSMGKESRSSDQRQTAQFNANAFSQGDN